MTQSGHWARLSLAVDQRPFVYHTDDIIKQAGLYSGCTFRDCGHVEAVRGLHNRAPNLCAAMEKFKSEQSTANYQP